MNVVVLPGSVQCGKCGHAMRHENHPFEIGKQVIMACWSHRCEWYEIQVVVPVTSIEVENANAS